MIYDQTFNMLFKEKMETIQYNAASAITGAITGSSKEKAISRIRLGNNNVGISNFAVSTKY